MEEAMLRLREPPAHKQSGLQMRPGLGGHHVRERDPEPAPGVRRPLRAAGACGPLIIDLVHDLPSSLRTTQHECPSSEGRSRSESIRQSL